MSKVTQSCKLGEAVHGAFRKATDCPQGYRIWQLITDMPSEEWNKVLEAIVEKLPPTVIAAMAEVA